MEIKDYILVTDNNLPLETIANFIKFANTRKFERATVIGGETMPQEELKKIRDVHSYPLNRLSNSISDIHWFNMVCKILKQNINIYKQKCPHFEYTTVQDISILKYEKLGHYDWHTDHAAAIPRTISSILFLNNDYVGGELMFENQITKEKTTIKPQPGRFIMWPSNFMYPHTVAPVLHGIRYTVVGWLL